MTTIAAAMRPPSVRDRTRSGTDVKSVSSRSMRYGSATTTSARIAVLTPPAGNPKSCATGVSSTRNASAPKNNAVSRATRVRSR